MIESGTPLALPIVMNTQTNTAVLPIANRETLVSRPRKSAADDLFGETVLPQNEHGACVDALVSGWPAAWQADPSFAAWVASDSAESIVFVKPDPTHLSD